MLSFIPIIALISPSKANRIVRSLIKLMNHLISSVGSFIRMQILANGAARTVGYAFLMSRASTLVMEPLFLPFDGLTPLRGEWDEYFLLRALLNRRETKMSPQTYR